MSAAVKKDVSGLVEPHRPALPPLFLVGLAFWFACATVLSMVRASGVDSVRGLFVVAAFLTAVSIVALLFGLRKKISILPFLLMASSIGFLLGAASACQLKIQEDAIGDSGMNSGLVRLEEDAKKGTYGWECLARLETGASDGVMVLLRMKDSVKGENALRYGDSYNVSFSLKSPHFESSAYCWNKGACAIVDASLLESGSQEALGGMILSVRNRAIDGFEAIGGEDAAVREPAAFLAAISCGYRSDLFDSSFYDAVKKCGLAHLVAVSGAHLVVVSSFVSSLLVALRLPRRAVFGVSAITIFAYLVLAGCPVSALRATAMSLVGSSSFLSGRRPSSLNALGLCALMLILLSPQTALSVSFLLSFASTAGIVLFSSYIAYALRVLVRNMPLLLAGPLSLTIASNLVCLPISISLFSQLPLVALFANVVCGLAFTPLCLVALLYGLVAALLPSLACSASGLVVVPTKVFCALVRGISTLPYSCIPITCDWALAVVLALGLPFLFWVFWPKITRSRAFAATFCTFSVLLLFVFVIPIDAGTRIVMLDVGQGDAFLVQSKGSTLLIDTGNQDKRLLEALARNNVRKIDAVLVTHADDDHCGSLKALSASVSVDNIILASDALESNEANYQKLQKAAAASAQSILTVEVGDTLRIGDIALRVVWPKGFANKGGNADSVCCMAFADIDEDGIADYRALFTGDAETTELEQIVKEGDIADIDILKVPHHGSKTGINDDLARRLSPKVALVSVGAGNRYGHPNDEVMTSLENAGSQIMRSDEQGDVSCRMTADAMEVVVQR